MLGGNERRLIERNAALLKSVEKKIAAKEAAVANPVRRDIDADDDIKKSSTAEARAKMGVARMTEVDRRVGLVISEILDIPEARAEQDRGFLRYAISKKDASAFGLAPFTILFEFCDADGAPCPAPAMDDVDNRDPVYLKGAWGPIGGRKMPAALFETDSFDAFVESAPKFKLSPKQGEVLRFTSPADFEVRVMEAVDSITTMVGGRPAVKISSTTDNVAKKMIEWIRAHKTRAEAAASHAVQSILSLCHMAFDAVFDSGFNSSMLVFPADDEWPEDALIYAPSLFGGLGAFYKNASEMAKKQRRRKCLPTMKKGGVCEEQPSLFNTTV